MNLKPFQQATVRRAVEALTDRRGSRRFLVADETGLGKTQIAKEVIRGMFLDDRPLKVFYVCSSLTIIHQNREALLEVLPPAQRAEAIVPVDRLTLLPSTKPSSRAPLTLYTLTPGTSVALGKRTGRVDERAVIWSLLRDAVDGVQAHGTLRDAFCRGIAGWQQAVEGVSLHGRSAVVAGFRRELSRELERRDAAWGSTIIGAMKELVAAGRDAELVGMCRAALARAAIDSIAPDLIVFDEFQRFFELLESDVDAEQDTGTLDPVSRSIMERLLRIGSDVSPGVLLLSATPYRLYTSWREDSGEHYRQFLELLGFLYGRGGRARVREIKHLLREYRTRLARDPVGSRDVLRVRDELRTRLGSVMCRTERPQSVGALRRVELRKTEAPLEPLDIRVFRHLRDAAKEKHRSFAPAYWASIPYPLQAMDQGYALAAEASPVKLEGQAARARISGQGVRRFQEIAHPHPRLRSLLQVVPPELLALPWMPPTREWWRAGGVFAEALQRSRGNAEQAQAPTDGPGPSKVLVFSHFRAVPRALAAVLSYEAERCAYAVARQRARRVKAVAYEYRTEAGKQPARGLKKRPPKSFTFPLSSKHETAMRSLLMFVPLPELARMGDPLRLAAATRKLELNDALRTVEKAIEQRIGSGPDHRAPTRPWAWAAALEKGAGRWRWYEAALRSFLQRAPRRQVDDGAPARGLEVAVESLLRESAPAGAPTRREIQELAEIALLGPGNVLYRCADRVFGTGRLSPVRTRTVAEVAVFGLRVYLDMPEFHVLLRSREHRNHAAAIRHAAWDGNLESVLDEQLAVARGLGVRETDAKAEAKSMAALMDALQLGASVVSLHETGLAHRAEPFRVRCHAAMALGASQERETGEGELHSADVRVAFNSPFRPHVLATTSIGQEGLDFHVWSRHIVHWDLPANPVDLEQRDGRVDRYAGLAVRQALAAQPGPLSAEGSPWRVLADRQVEARNGMSPWWIADGATVRQTVFIPPFSRLRGQLEALLEQLSLYRLALGQSDQEALVSSLQRRIKEAGESAEAVRRWLDKARIDLRPMTVGASRAERSGT